MNSRILVIRGGAIGDFILTLPAIRLIRENFPQCAIEILGYRHIAALADGRFYAEATRSIDYGPLAGFFNPRSDLDPGLVAYFTGFQQIVSYIFDPDRLFESGLRRAGVRNLISASPKIAAGTHAAHQLARPLESLALWLEDPAARLFPSDADLAAAEKILAGRDGPFIAIHPGSGSQTKNWPLDGWLALAQWIPSTIGHLLVVGGESDDRQLAALRSLNSDGMTFLEGLPLPVLAAIFSKCRLFVGHDSGISHLAAAAGAPCVLLFGPTDPGVWAPANPGVHVLAAPDGDLSRVTLRTVCEAVTAASAHPAAGRCTNDDSGNS